MPAAPAPLQTSLVVAISRPVRSSALIRPAAAMMAVPCWSSWKTGMSSSSRSRCSMTKHSGALMSSRLMPPQPAPSSLTQLMNSSGSSVETSRSIEFDVGKALEQHRLAFHHRLCRQRAAIAEPEDGRAVGDDGDEIALHRVVVGPARILGDRQHRHRDARRIGERKVALGRHRLGGDDLQFAGPANAVKLQGFLVGEGRPAAAGGGLGGHYYSMNTTGMPGRVNVSGCNRRSREEHGTAPNGTVE